MLEEQLKRIADNIETLCKILLEDRIADKHPRIPEDPVKDTTVSPDTENEAGKKEVTEKPKRKRRTKEEIEAEKIAKAERAVEREEKAKVPYNRELQEHKDEFLEILNDRCPNWKQSKDSKAKAKQISISLHGSTMFDKHGILVGEFVDKIIEGMAEFESNNDV